MLSKKKFLKNKRILLTGGTGSFGLEFTSFILKNFKPKRLVIFSRDELKQHNMQQEFPVKKYPMLRYFIGDIRDFDRLDYAMEDIDLIIHAAALKHVSVAEYNPMEFVNTNIIGTQNIIKASIKNNISKVILLSTDKAVNPINLYGSTKLCAEKMFVAANNIVGRKKTKFSIVRYGNVFGSRGSLIEKILNFDTNKKFEITDRSMTRFWIYLKNAIEFVCDAIDEMKGGEVFIPKMSSSNIVKLVEKINPKLKIKIVGVRPGEKYHESLISMEDSETTYEFKNCFIIYPKILINRSNVFANKKYKNQIGKKVSKSFLYTSQECKDRLDILSFSRMSNELKKIR